MPSPPAEKHAIRPGQSIELLKELHILTRDGQPTTFTYDIR